MDRRSSTACAGSSSSSSSSSSLPKLIPVTAGLMTGLTSVPHVPEHHAPDRTPAHQPTLKSRPREDVEKNIFQNRENYQVMIKNAQSKCLVKIWVTLPYILFFFLGGVNRNIPNFLTSSYSWEVWEVAVQSWLLYRRSGPGIPSRLLPGGQLHQEVQGPQQSHDGAHHRL